MNSRLFFLAGLALAAPFCASADVALPHILAEHMVVQRGLPVHVWGKASAGEAVSVGFRGATQATTADQLGRWSVSLAPGDAGGPFTMTIKGNNTITFNDVLAGDVWVASGQSNMEFKLRQADNSAAEIAAAKYPKIRRMLTDNKVADYPMEDVTGQPWTDINPDNAGGASAVAYFFARHLQEKEGGVPIGIVESFWGGTPVEAWTSLHGIAADPALMPIFGEWAKAEEAWPVAQSNYERLMAEWNVAAAAAKASGGTVPPQPANPNLRPGGPFVPSGLYNAKIAPLTPFPIKGAIWYQGETNANANPNGASLYAKAFQAMIRDWRRAWGEGDFPFLFVQLANYKANPSGPI
jgi:sialate O-acetylesterase